MKKFEYKVVAIGKGLEKKLIRASKDLMGDMMYEENKTANSKVMDEITEELENRFNVLGSDGWRMVSSLAGSLVVLIREKS